MAYDFSKFKQEKERIKEWLVKEYRSLHTGRATPAVLDNVSIEVYGARGPIAHSASISVEDARTLRVSPWDKGVIKIIEKAIGESQLGLTVSVDDQGLRVMFPELSGERRQALARVVKEKLEDARISVRKERERVWNDIQEKEKGNEISEDDKFRLKDELQKLVDEANKELEEIAERKEKEINS